MPNIYSNRRHGKALMLVVAAAGLEAFASAHALAARGTKPPPPPPFDPTELSLIATVPDAIGYPCTGEAYTAGGAPCSLSEGRIAAWDPRDAAFGTPQGRPAEGADLLGAALANAERKGAQLDSLAARIDAFMEGATQREAERERVIAELRAELAKSAAPAVATK